MTWLLSVMGVLLLVEMAWSFIGLRRTATPLPPSPFRLAHYPSVTVVKPVRGCDVGAAENFAAALDADYPGEVETLFIFDDEADPGLPVARAVVAAHEASGGRGKARVIVAGPPPEGRTGKLNAMILGAQLAQGELVAFGDSDTRPDRHVLRVLVEAIETTPRAGSAFAPVVVRGPLRTAGDVAYALMINALYGTAVAHVAAERGGSVPFIMGQLMVLRRDALASIGGIGCAEGQLVDDMYIGKCLAELGWENVQVSYRLPIVVGGMGLVAFARQYRRWILFSRGGLPLSFTWPMWMRGIEFWLGLVATIVACLVAPLAIVLPLAAVVAYGAGLARLEEAFGGERLRARHLWVPFALVLGAPLVALSTLVGKKVEWRGRAYALDWKARLA